MRYSSVGGIGGIGGGNRIAAAWNAISGGDGQSGGRGGLNGDHGISSKIFWQLHHSWYDRMRQHWRQEHVQGGKANWRGSRRGGVAVVDGGDGNWLVTDDHVSVTVSHRHSAQTLGFLCVYAMMWLVTRNLPVWW